MQFLAFEVTTCTHGATRSLAVPLRSIVVSMRSLVVSTHEVTSGINDITSGIHKVNSGIPVSMRSPVVFMRSIVVSLRSPVVSMRSSLKYCSHDHDQRTIMHNLHDKENCTIIQIRISNPKSTSECTRKQISRPPLILFNNML